MLASLACLRNIELPLVVARSALGTQAQPPHHNCLSHNRCGISYGYDKTAEDKDPQLRPLMRQAVGFTVGNAADEKCRLMATPEMALFRKTKFKLRRDYKEGKFRH